MPSPEGHHPAKETDNKHQTCGGLGGGMGKKLSEGSRWEEEKKSE